MTSTTGALTCGTTSSTLLLVLLWRGGRGRFCDTDTDTAASGNGKDASDGVLLNDDAMVDGVLARAGKVPGALKADRLVVEPARLAEPGRRMGSMGSSWNCER